MHQKVTIRLVRLTPGGRDTSVFPDDPEPVEVEVERTNHRNLRSKISEAVKRLLLQYNVIDGATITINIEKAVVDEYANPER